jgi:DNA-binding transcriptional LysR family regulator
MDMRHLETFVKITELRSFTKAAEALYLTQPTVSKQVFDLERFFGIRLLDRTKGDVTPTKAGHIVLRYARQFLALRKDLLSTMDAFKGLHRGNIVIGASSIPGIYILPAILNVYKKRYGEIDLKLVISDTKATLDRLEEGELDIGFVGAKRESTNIDYRKLVDDTLVFIGPSGMPEPMEVSAFLDHPFVIREAGSGTRNVLEKSLKEHLKVKVSDLRIAAEFSDSEAVKKAVKSGLGVSMVSRMAIEDDLLSGSLNVLTVQGFPEVRRAFYTVTRKGRALSPQVKALINLIDEWRRNEKT